jgi:hypothetical protein
MSYKQIIQVFLDQKRDAFKTTLQQLAEYGVTIRSFTELHDQVMDVENGLPSQQQLLIQAYRNALLVSTVEALFKEVEASKPAASHADVAKPGRDEGQQRETERGAEHV